MGARVRGWLTYSNVVSTFCLFVLLGGSAVAAAQISGSRLKNRSITSAKLKDGAVTSAKVKNGSLLSRDFKAGQLSAGPQGPTGPQGQQGPAGAPGAAGSPAASLILGRSSTPLNAAAAVEYLSPSGTSAPATFSTVSMLSSAQPVVARDFAVKLSTPVIAPWSRDFKFAIDGVSQSFGCTVPSGGTTCTTGDATLTIQAAKSIAIQTSGPGVPGAALAEFGWRATTP